MNRDMLALLTAKSPGSFDYPHADMHTPPSPQVLISHRPPRLAYYARGLIWFTQCGSFMDFFMQTKGLTWLSSERFCAAKSLHWTRLSLLL